MWRYWYGHNLLQELLIEKKQQHYTSTSFLLQSCTNLNKRYIVMQIAGFLKKK